MATIKQDGIDNPPDTKERQRQRMLLVRLEQDTGVQELREHIALLNIVEMYPTQHVKVDISYEIDRYESKILLRKTAILKYIFGDNATLINPIIKTIVKTIK